jgi:hypothetical protein
LIGATRLPQPFGASDQSVKREQPGMTYNSGSACALVHDAAAIPPTVMLRECARLLATRRPAPPVMLRACAASRGKRRNVVERRCRARLRLDAAHSRSMTITGFKVTNLLRMREAPSRSSSLPSLSTCESCGVGRVDSRDNGKTFLLRRSG